jgi:hypothetical protein
LLTGGVESPRGDGSESWPVESSPLVIHIGLRKAGSSTIQRFFKHHASALAERGLLYAPVGVQAKGHHVLARQLRMADYSRSWAELVAYRKASPKGALVVSSELLEETEPAQIADLKRLFPAESFRIILLVRPHLELLPSLYAQRTKLGQNFADFDAFFERTITRPRLRFFDTAERWADVFGWEAIRALLLHQQYRASGGDLVSDFLGLVGADRAARSQAQAAERRSMNKSPGWRVLELLRQLYRDHESGAGPSLRNKTVSKTVQACAVAVGTAMQWNQDQGRYLSDEQMQACETLFDAQLAALNRHLVHDRLPSVEHRAHSGLGRQFMPDAGLIAPQDAAVFHATLRTWLAQGPDTKAVLPVRPTDEAMALPGERQVIRTQRRDERRTARRSRRPSS